MKLTFKGKAAGPKFGDLKVGDFFTTTHEDGGLFMKTPSVYTTHNTSTPPHNSVIIYPRAGGSATGHTSYWADSSEIVPVDIDTIACSYK